MRMSLRTQARFFNPRLRELGLITHSAIMLSNASGATRSPLRASITKSYFRLWPALGIWASVIGPFKASITCAEGKLWDSSSSVCPTGM